MAFKPGQDRFFHCTVFFSFMAVPKIGDTPNVTLDSDSPIPIYPKIGQNRFFLLYGSVKNRQCSIFEASYIGATTSDSPTLIYLKTNNKTVFMTLGVPKTSIVLF